MRNLVPCEQDNRKAYEFRRDQERRFFEYLQTQRRRNPRYYEIRCHLKLDFVTFSLYLGKKKEGKQDEKQLDPLLNDLRNRRAGSPNYNYNQYDYDVSTTYIFYYDNKKYELNVACASKQPYKPYLITIHDPTEEVLRFLQQYLEQVTYYHARSIEFTYDFYSEANDLVRNFIKRHVIVSWRGKGYHPEYEKSFYGNNIRFATGKGLRSYEKEEKIDKQNQDFVRMEMLLKRPILKSNGIHKIDDIINMNPKIPNKYFKFKSYNYSQFKKVSQELLKDQNELEEELRYISDKIQKGYLYEMNKYSLEVYKKYYNYSYLKVCKYYKHFIHQFRYSSFLNGDDFGLSLLLMEDEF